MGSGTGSGNEQMVFNITNARDAEYREISATDNYVAGGSQWNGANNDNNYRGCYHFFAKEKGDMIFKLATEGSSMCKIYKIQIYRGDRIDTNEIMGATENDKYLLWSRAADPNDESDEAAIGSTYNWTLNYFGKDQKIADGSNEVNNDIVNYNGYFAKSGASINNDGFTTSTETDPTQPLYNTFTYQHDYGQIGTFRMRGKDMEKNMKYVADFGEHNVTVAYQQTMKYPYTWDFMDMTGWENNVQNFVYEDGIGTLMVDRPVWYVSDGQWNASYEKSSSDLSLWEVDSQDNTYYLRLNSQSGQTSGNLKEKDNIFETAKDIDGNQVWANGAVVPETQGLWFYTLNNNSNNGTWGVTNDGLAFNGLSTTIQKVVVPNVPAGAAVYLRMVKDRDAYDHAFEFKGGNSDYKVYGPTLVVGTTDEYILAIKNEGAKRHLTLSLAGYQLKKLAVSEDPKTVNIKGYASESHKRVIDHSLTSFFTGKPIYAYTAENYNESESKIDLVKITKPMPAATADGQTVGSVLYNSEAEQEGNTDATINILDGGFHLFVPDMHDYTGNPNNTATELQNTSNNLMKSYNAGGTGNTTIAQKGDDGVRYVLSYQYYDHDKDGQTLNTAQEEAFYRVAKGGAGIKPNSAYISFPSTALAKVSFLFEDELFGQSQGITTVIDNASSNEDVKEDNAEWYNINGQKLNGKPTSGGLYIVNGRKVLVK